MSPRLYELLKSSIDKIFCNQPHSFLWSNYVFITYAVVQVIETATVRHQMIKQNKYLTKTGLITFFNINEIIMHNWMNTSLLTLSSILGIETTYLSPTSSKWFVLVSKKQKEKSRLETDAAINNTTFSPEKIEKTWRFNRFNIRSSLVSYTAALRHKFTPAGIEFVTPSNNDI